MATQRDLRRRITSVQNTRKITKAMEMVAAARLRRSQQRIESLRPYAIRLNEFIAGLARYVGPEQLEEFPLLRVHPEVQRVAVIALTGDRGLSGAFNSNIIRRTWELIRRYESRGIETDLIVVGKKGIGTFRFQRRRLLAAYQGLTDRPGFSDAQAIAHRVAELYTSGQVDRVHVVYNSFKSAVEQTVTDQVVLPIQEELSARHDQEAGGLQLDFLYEPPAHVILSALLPSYIETVFYRALLESTASAYGAQMTAMRNASEAAGEMIDELTLLMNRVRQASITQELLEVVAGADALE